MRDLPLSVLKQYCGGRSKTSSKKCLLNPAKGTQVWSERWLIACVVGRHHLLNDHLCSCSQWTQMASNWTCTSWEIHPPSLSQDQLQSWKLHKRFNTRFENLSSLLDERWDVIRSKISKSSSLHLKHMRLTWQISPVCSLANDFCLTSYSKQAFINQWVMSQQLLPRVDADHF